MTSKEALEILNDIEKAYLSNIIKPFRNKVSYIEKVNNSIRGSTLSFIFISLKNGECISLPLFNSNEIYKNMISDKKYTIKKLGL